MIQTHRAAGALCGVWLVASTLAGCAGGGGGAASTAGTSPGLGIVTDTAPVLASSNTGISAPSVFGSVLFPLYGIMDESYVVSTLGAARVGTRTQAADGSITLTYVDSAGPQRVTFLPGEFLLRDSEANIAQRGSLFYSETWADNAAGFALQHMRVGLFIFPDRGGSIPALFGTCQ